MRHASKILLILTVAAGFNASAFSQQAGKPFDLTSPDHDANGLPRDPHWKWQEGVNAGKQPDPEKLCPSGLPNDSTCTSQDTTENLPTIPNVFVCMWQMKSRLIGHINWQVATIAGEAIWRGLAADRDCNWASPTVQNAALTSGNADHLLDLEFASGETIRDAKTDFWSALWKMHKQDPKAVNEWLRSKTSDHAAPFMVLTGLFGVDCEHECHSEMHPVYAVALQVSDSPSDNTWAVLVRNWGNEGFCAHGTMQAHFPKDKLRLFLPVRSTDSPQILPSSQIYGTNGVGIPIIQYVASSSNPGLLLEVQLGKPDAKDLGEFELHLKWPEGTIMPKATMVGLGLKYLDLGLKQNESNTAEEFLQNFDLQEYSVPESQSLRRVLLKLPLSASIPKVFQWTAPENVTVPISVRLDPIDDRFYEKIFIEMCKRNPEKTATQTLIPAACKNWDSFHRK